MGNLEVRASSGRRDLQAPCSKNPGTGVKGNNTLFLWPIPPLTWGELSQDSCITFLMAITKYLISSNLRKPGLIWDHSLRMQSVMMGKAWHGDGNALDCDYSFPLISTEQAA